MKPILFNTEMIRAIQNDTKTVTRRVVKPPALYAIQEDADGRCIGSYYEDEKTAYIYPTVDDCLYQPGDILYVRETWQHGFGGTYLYKASAGHDLFMTPEGKLVSDIPWRPSIHMPPRGRAYLPAGDKCVGRKIAGY